MLCSSTRKALSRTALTLVLLSGGMGADMRQLQAAGEIDASGAIRTGTIVREGDILAFDVPAIQRRGVAGQSGALWPHGIVPVWIDPSLASASARTIRQAMARWNEVAGIRFEELATRPGKGLDHVLFESGEGCASWVGRRGGAQSLWVAPVCNVGSVMHELGHALGLEHEHTRPDRDAWIQIHWDSVLPEKRHNFDRAPDGTPTLGEYDYASIMHYGPDFFSADGSRTIEPLYDPAVRIGQRDAPSAGDIAAIAELYGTDVSVSAELFAATVPAAASTRADQPTHELDLYVTNEGMQGAHDVIISVDLARDWDSIGRHRAVDDWQCEEGDASVTCRLDRLSVGASAQLSLALKESTSGESTGSTNGPLSRDAPDAPLGVRVSTGSDDRDGSNDARVVQLVSDGERSAGEWFVLADGSGAGDAQSTPGAIRTGIGLGSAGPLWGLLAALALIRRQRRCRLTICSSTA